MIPPYVAYKTFRNFLEFLKDNFPSRIDRSVWGPRYSGTSGQQLMTALKVLNLIDENGIPKEILTHLVNSEGENRRSILRRILMNTYEPIFKIDLTKATKSQFHEVFKSFNTKEGVIIKCEAFFIQACQDAGIELSSFILARRHTSSRKNILVQSELKLFPKTIVLILILIIILLFQVFLKSILNLIHHGIRKFKKNG